MATKSAKPSNGQSNGKPDCVKPDCVNLDCVTLATKPSQSLIVTAQLLKLASEPIRAEILLVLCDAPTTHGRLVETIVDCRRESISGSAMSMHLKMLAVAGMIESCRNGHGQPYQLTMKGGKLADVVAKLGS